MSVLVSWNYFDRYGKVTNEYMPMRGEGETMASQIVTAVNKLIYKWYNDGDVFDNTYYLTGWCNDLSSYANWLAEYAGAKEILDNIGKCWTNGDYEWLLKKLADYLLGDEKKLEEYNKHEKIGSIYKCEGVYKFVEWSEEDEEEDWEW